MSDLRAWSHVGLFLIQMIPISSGYRCLIWYAEYRKTLRTRVLQYRVTLAAASHAMKIRIETSVRHRWSQLGEIVLEPIDLSLR